MKREIENWWLEYNLPISEVIKVGLRNNPGLTKPAIQAGCEAVYKENTPNLILPRYKLAWKVWKYARVIEASEKRDVYVIKYEGERKELTLLRVKRVKYEQIRTINIHDLAILHGSYWLMISSILALIYFLGT